MSNYLSEISVKHLNDRLNRGEDILLLDVREQHEYGIANLKGLLVPLGQLAQRMSEIDPSREIIVYCHHGNRSAVAVQFLQTQGFEKVSNLVGGIDRWSQEIDRSVPRY